MKITNKFLKLNDLVKSVIDNRGKTPPLSDGPYELIETTSITGKNKFPDYSKITKFVDKNTYLNWFRKGHPKINDILIATVGANIGNVVIMKENRGCVGQNLVALRINEEKSDANYIYYLLSTTNIQEALKGLDIGSAQPSIKVSHFLNLQLNNIHNISEQKEISKLLSKFDDTIENYLKKINILDSIIKKIYLSFFKNFNSLNFEKKIKFKETELGKIPENWSIIKVNDIADIYNGCSYSSSDIFENSSEGNLFIGLKSINKNGGFRDDFTEKRYIGKFKKTHLVYNGSLIIAVTDMTQERAVVGRIARIPNIEDKKAIISMDLVNVIPKKNIPNNYLYDYFRFSNVCEHLKEFANGTNVLHLKKEVIENFKIILPTQELINRYSNNVEMIYNYMDNLHEKIKKIKNLREKLLSKLIFKKLNLNKIN